MADDSARRWDAGRDTLAALLLCAAPLLPWNLYFGVGVPGSRPLLFAAVAVVTLLALASIAVGRAGRLPAVSARFKTALCLPYLLLVAGFVLFDAVQTVRYGGTAQVPGGVGPGAWLGVTGAVLAAQPTSAAAVRPEPLARSARVLGYVSLIGAGLSVLFNLYWRSRYALAGAAGFGRQQAAVIGTALVYGLVAWTAVWVAARWMRRGDIPARLAASMLGAATLAAGALVWITPVGRYIDGFHGIAQNTSTAGVGFEAYLVWAAVAAIVAVPTLRASAAVRSRDADAWLTAGRMLTVLVIAWAGGSVLMRITDLAVAAELELGYPPYDSVAMAAFDLVTAVLAIWLWLNLTNRAVRPVTLWSLCAVLFGLTISRIVVGVGLAPRTAVAQRSTQLADPVYGNGFAQQITSTFDVVLCGLALCVAAIAIVAARRPVGTPAHRPGAPRIFRRSAGSPATTGGPRIFRPQPDPGRQAGSQGSAKGNSTP